VSKPSMENKTVNESVGVRVRAKERERERESEMQRCRGFYILKARAVTSASLA